MKWISSTDLKHWADTRSCQEMLPELIKRLIVATSSKINKLRFPSGDSIHLSGWDGILLCEENIFTISFGISLWEFGASPQIKKKAEEDYQKRKLDTLGYISTECTYVFVTPRIWDKAEKWIIEKRKENFWKNVVVLTAIEIEDWLSQNPSVGLWLAEHMRKSHSLGVRTINSFWKKWSTGKEFSLKPSILLGGREKEKINVLEYTENASICIVQSMSQEESLAFIVASIIDAANPFVLSRCIIVENENTLGQLIETYKSLVIIAIVENRNHIYAVQNGHSIFYVSDISETNQSNNILALPQIDRDKFIESLKESGLNREYASQLSRETVRNITILRRKLEFDFTNPEWTRPENIRDLIPAILVGRWKDFLDADKMLLASIANEPYDSYIIKLQRWLHSSDSPIINVDGVWRIISPYEAFSFALKHIAAVDFIRYKDAFMAVVDDIDSDALAKSQSTTLKFWKNEQKYSVWLKEGLAQSAILISILGENTTIATSISGNIWIDNLINDILQNTTLEWWLSFKRILPQLAEASPKNFIKFIQNDLTQKQSIVKTLFVVKEERNLLFGAGVDYTDILFALEALAWQKEYLLSVSLILAELSGIENDTNIGNKPFNSLISIYKVWYPQTFADTQERNQVFALVCKKFPKQGFNLCVTLLSRFDHDTTFPTHSMRWRFFGQYKKDEISYQDIRDAVSNTIKQLINSCDLSVDQIIPMIKISSQKALGEENRQLILNYVEENISNYQGNVNISNKLRDEIYHHRSFPDADWALPKHEIAKYESLLTSIEPKQLKEKYLWMFRKTYLETLELDRFDSDFRKRWDRTIEERSKLLKEIFMDEGIEGICDFINKVEAPDSVGAPYAHICQEEDLKHIFLMAKEERIPTTFSRNFFCQYGNIKGINSFIEKIDSLKDNYIDFIYFPLSSLNISSEVWKYVEHLPETSQKQYWENATIGWYDNSEENIIYIINKLNQVGRFKDSLDIIHHSVDNSKISSKVIMDTILLIIQNPTVELLQHQSYELAHLISFLDKQEDVNNEHIIQIELLLYELLEKYVSVSDLRLKKVLFTEPESMMEIIKAAYMSSNEKENEQEESNKSLNSSAFSLLSFKFLWNLGGTPYVDENNDIDENSLNNYIDRLRELGRQYNRLEHVDRIIGELLANYPETSLYPPDAICRIIERINSRSLNQGFNMRIFNKRGVTIRPALSGGYIEREDSKKYKGYADSTRFLYPIIAEIFDDLSEEYEKMALRDDNQTKIESMEY